MQELLHAKNPESENSRISMQAPQLCRMGTKKTLWNNFQDICKSLSRSPEHVYQVCVPNDYSPPGVPICSSSCLHLLTSARCSLVLLQFFMAELGTEGSIDGNQRLVIRGKYLPRAINTLLKKYIKLYVTCNECNNAHTSLAKDSVTRLYNMTCEACGSTRTVAPIKAGFHAQTRADRKLIKAAAN